MYFARIVRPEKEISSNFDSLLFDILKALVVKIFFEKKQQHGRL